MALDTLPNVKAALALAEAQINIALGDTSSAGEIAKELQRPEHPLRDLNQLFVINPSTGEFTVDVAYVDAAYVAAPGIKTTKNQIVLSKLT